MSDDFYDGHYTRAPDQLDPHQELRLEVITSLCERLFGSLEGREPPPAICDVGSGRGWLAGALGRFGAVTGVEPSAVGVERARRDFAQGGRVRFYQGTAGTLLDLGMAGSFDLVVSSEVIEHVEDQQGFLLGLRRLLRPAGHLILTTPRLAQRRAWERIGPRKQPLEKWLDDRQLARLVAGAGFRVLEQARGYVAFTRYGLCGRLEGGRLARLLARRPLGPVRRWLRHHCSLYQFVLAQSPGADRAGG